MKRKMSARGKIQDLRISLLDYVICFFADAIVSYVISVLVGCIALGVGFSGILYAMNHRYVLIATLLITLIGFVPLVLVMRFQLEQHYVMRRLKNAKRGIDGNLENSHFQTMREMAQNGYRIYNSLDELRDAESGIILNMEERGKGKMRTIFSPETIHTLVIGTTGSGKTSSYIIPSIKALALTTEATRPSFLFTDPKGELYEKTAWYLKEHGYKILSLDFRHPERSLRWNPLMYAWTKMCDAQGVLDRITMQMKRGMPTYRLNGRDYDGDAIDSAARAEIQRLEDEAYEEIINIVAALCPITSSKDPIWDEGAKGLIQGVVMAMLEDGMSPDDVGMTEDKFNFYNLHQICTHAGAGYKDLIEYFQYRDKKSRAVSSAEIVLVAPQQQQGSYMSSVQQKLQMFNDRGICNMTSSSEIDVKEMDEQPTAVYLMLPDEKEGRHPLGSLFISQCYKKLVEKAVENGGSLKRRVFFMMDEYGNMPKIDGVQSMYTVGRSRGIIQIPVIQSYSQIIDKYGQEMARTIFGNCNTEVFIGSKDNETCKQFSEKLGNYTVLSASVSGGKHAVEHSFNESVKERPLMYPRELTLLNNKHDMGNVVVINQGYSPTLGTFTPYFKSKAFPLGETPEEALTPRALDEDAVLFDFKSRVQTIIADYEDAMTDPQEGGEMKRQDSEIRQESQSEDSKVIERLSEIAKQYEMEFSDDVSENMETLEVLIDALREDMKLTLVNEVAKLKTEYLQAVGQTAGRTQE